MNPPNLNASIRMLRRWRFSKVYAAFAACSAACHVSNIQGYEAPSQRYDILRHLDLEAVMKQCRSPDAIELEGVCAVEVCKVIPLKSDIYEFSLDMKALVDILSAWADNTIDFLLLSICRLYKYKVPPSPLLILVGQSLHPQGLVKYPSSTLLFPVGHCVSINENFEPAVKVPCDGKCRWRSCKFYHHRCKYFGFMKVTVQAPPRLNIPLLPIKTSDSKLVFPLCGKCAERRKRKCNDTLRERSMTQEWSAGCRSS